MFFILLNMFLCAIPAGVHAFISFKNTKKSYFYVYFVSYYLFTIPFFTAFSTLGQSGATLGPGLFILTVYGIPCYISAFFCIKRRLWGFCFSSFLSLNPFFWIFSPLYYFLKRKESIWQNSASKKYILHDGSKQFDPMTLTEIKVIVSQGFLNENHFFWDNQKNSWEKLSILLK